MLELKKVMRVMMSGRGEMKGMIKQQSEELPGVKKMVGEVKKTAVRAMESPEQHEDEEECTQCE